MPTLTTLARLFATLSAADVILGLAVTASILVLVSDWRLSLLALTAQYFLITVLLTTIVQLQVATVRLIAGALVASMLYLTARSVRSQRMRRARAAGWTNVEDLARLFEREPFIIGWPFRLIAVVLVMVCVIAASAQFPLPNVPMVLWLQSLWLCAMGILLIAITRDALKLGMGLFTFTSGFAILYVALDPNLLFYGLLVISDLLIGLAISHLAGAPASATESRRGEV